VEGKKIVLDWSRLLGFDQASREDVVEPRISDPRLGKLGSKVGSKGCSVRRDGGSDVGVKVGAKVGVKIGAKVGLKPSLAA
jgi:hypothetical protein